MTKKVNISIIIPCFNAEKHIKRCLDSILKSNFSSYEAIIIDDASSDKIQKLLAKYKKFKKFKVVVRKINQGPARARNLGTKIARGRYLFFLDIDTEVEKNCLSEIYKKFKNNKRIGGLQVKMETNGHFLSILGFPYETQKSVKLIFGARSAGLAIRKELFEKINGFDEDYLIYAEDTDLCWRVWLAGYEIHFLGTARVRHFQKSSLTSKTNARLFYEGAKNNTSNILKNANLKILVWILPLHVLGWLIISLKLILSKRPSKALSVWQGLIWNLKNLGKTLQKRKTIASYTTKNNQANKIMFGNISFSNFLVKGLKWFKSV